MEVQADPSPCCNIQGDTNVNGILNFPEYMLQVDPEKRPDIYQVSALAFRIVGRETPVQNLHVSLSHSKNII